MMSLVVNKEAYTVLLQQTNEGRAARAAVCPSGRTCRVSSERHATSDDAPKNQIIKTPFRAGREKPEIELMSLVSAKDVHRLLMYYTPDVSH
jgi:hypothetical protein